MNGMESLKMAIYTIWSNKMRTLLTMLGIVIGISSVIALVSVGQGSQKKIQKDFANMGANRAQLYMDYEKEVDETAMYNRRDIDAIRRTFGNQLNGISASGSLSGKFFSGKKEISMNVNAVNETFNRIENLKIAKGRFLNKSDLDESKATIVLDAAFADKVHKTRDILGQRITLQTDEGSTSFLIVGLYTKQKSSFDFGGGNSYTAYAPISYVEMETGNMAYDSVTLSFKESDRIDQKLAAITQLVEKRHNEVGSGLYRSYNAEREMAMMNKITGQMTLLVSVIAGISLVVGGIGIMNIMLVSVTERTREIGIRKAIGASRFDILGQFLIESALVSLFGGLIGIAFGMGIGQVIGGFMKIPPAVSPQVIMIAVVFSSAIGLFFGIYPANKASNLDPIEALRYE